MRIFLATYTKGSGMCITEHVRAFKAETEEEGRANAQTYRDKYFSNFSMYFEELTFEEELNSSFVSSFN